MLENLNDLKTKIYYQIKDFLFPWNVIKIRSLPRNYVDTDLIMEEVLIQLFIDYIEIEKPFNHFNIDKSSCKQMWRDLADLYIWFKITYPSLKEKLEQTRYTIEGEEDLDRQLTIKLCELIRYRKHFWT